LVELSLIFEKRIIPLLQDYFYSDWERIAWVLNDHNKPSEFQFIQMKKADNSAIDLFGEEVASQLNDRRYQINHDALKRAESYALTINESKSSA
jgi:5-methylcytosine-specific restriction protein B